MKNSVYAWLYAHSVWCLARFPHNTLWINTETDCVTEWNALLCDDFKKLDALSLFTLVEMQIVFLQKLTQPILYDVDSEPASNSPESDNVLPAEINEQLEQLDIV